MADAYTRIHNGKRIGVCAVQAGPGTENAFVGVAQAYADSSPILMLTGGATRDRVGLPALTDSVGHYRGVTKWADTINGADRVSEMASRAFTKMRNGRRRPVLLELPPRRRGANRSTRRSNRTCRRARTPAPAIPKDVAAGDRRCCAKRASRSSTPARACCGARPRRSYSSSPSCRGPGHDDDAGQGRIPGRSCALARHRRRRGHRHGRSLPAGMRPGLLSRREPHADARRDADPGRARRSFTARPTPTISTPSTARRTRSSATSSSCCGSSSTRSDAQGGRKDDGAAAEVQGVRDAWLAQWMPKLTSDETPICPYRVVWDLMNTIDRANSIVTHDSGTPRAQMAPF